MFKMSNVALDTLQTLLPSPQSPANSVFKVLPFCENFITKSAKNPIKDLCREQMELQHIWPGRWFISACLVPTAQECRFSSLSQAHTHTNTYTGAGVMLFFVFVVVFLVYVLQLLNSFYSSGVLLHSWNLPYLSFHLSVFSLLHPSLLRWVAKSA